MEGRVIGEWLLELKRKSVCGKGDFERREVVENYLDFGATGWWRLRRSGVCGRLGVKAFRCLESRVEYRLITFRSYEGNASLKLFNIGI